MSTVSAFYKGIEARVRVNGEERERFRSTVMRDGRCNVIIAVQCHVDSMVKEMKTRKGGGMELEQNSEMWKVMRCYV